MSIEIPNLDDLTYQQLVDNLVRSIPQYSGQWTDYNPSDPGITILEMLSWISQSLLYRANNISDESYRNYLKLIAGDHVYEPEDHLHTELLNELKNWPTPQSAEGLATITSKVQAYWSTSNRVIAEVDYYALSLEAYYMECARQLGKPFNTQIRYRQQSLSHLQQLKRIFVNAEIALEHGPKVKRIEVIVNTAPDPRERAPSAHTNAYNRSDSDKGKQQTNKPFEPAIKPMLMAIKNFIVPRRPVGTLLSVRQVDNTNIDLVVSLVFASSSQHSIVTAAIDERVASYVNAFTGGRDHSGWPLGESLVSSDLVRLIGEVNGVAGVTNVQLNDYVVIVKRKQETPDYEIPKGGLQIYYKPSPAAVSQNTNTDTDKGADSGSDPDSKPWSILVKPAEFESFKSDLSIMVEAAIKAIKALKHQLKLLDSEPNTPQSAEQKQKLEAELSTKTATLSSLESLQKAVNSIWQQASEKVLQQEKQSDQDQNNSLTQTPTAAQISHFISGKNVPFSFLNISELIGQTQIVYPQPKLTGKHNES